MFTIAHLITTAYGLEQNDLTLTGVVITAVSITFLYFGYVARAENEIKNYWYLTLVSLTTLQLLDFNNRIIRYVFYVFFLIVSIYSLRGFYLNLRQRNKDVKK